MKQFLKNIFSAPKIVENSVNAVIAAGDKSFLTKEESAELYLKLMESVKPSAISRRIVAWIVVGMVALMSLLAIGLHVGGMTEQATYIRELMADVWAWPFVAVCGFYFGAGLLQGKGK